MSVWNYPVSNKFKPGHSGEDRAAPSGTPIPVGGVLLGVVGSTGISTGPHIHTQKAVRNVSGWGFVNPAGGGQNVTGKVSEVLYNAEVGHCVRILANDGIRWSYFHMRDKPLVKVGDTIGGNMANNSSTKEEIISTYTGFFEVEDKDTPPNIIGAFTGKPISELLTYLHQDNSYKAHKYRVNNPPGNCTPDERAYLDALKKIT